MVVGARTLRGLLLATLSRYARRYHARELKPEMPNCDFYATLEDHEQLLQWLFEEGACKVFELSSDVEQPVKEFRSVGEVLSQFDRTYITGAKWDIVYLQLYVLGASPPFSPRRVNLDPKACDGATFRYVPEGWGLVQLYLGTATARGLNHSHTNHFSQKAAQVRGPEIPDMQDVRVWDFKKITAFSSRLNRQINKLGVAKVRSRPMLPGALRLWQEGACLLANQGGPTAYSTQTSDVRICNPSQIAGLRIPSC